MSFIKKAGLLLSAVLILGVCGCGSTDTSDTNTPVTLDISAAASMTNALKEVNALYMEEHSWVTITENYAASGTLQTQIENGAPCDVFFSAAPKQMTALEDQGLLLDGTRKDLLTNSIVMIVPNDSTLGLTSFNDLTLDKVKLIGVGAVGQPRDDDPRAAAIVYNTTANSATLLRVKYDVEAARKRILHAGLPVSLANRLTLGK